MTDSVMSLDHLMLEIRASVRIFLNSLKMYSVADPDFFVRLGPKYSIPVGLKLRWVPQEPRTKYRLSQLNTKNSELTAFSRCHHFHREPNYL